MLVTKKARDMELNWIELNYLYAAGINTDYKPKAC